MLFEGGIRSPLVVWGPDLAVRYGEWKLLCDYDGGRPRLYDIVSDPGESRNLAESYPDIAARLVTQVTSWYQALSAQS